MWRAFEVKHGALFLSLLIAATLYAIINCYSIEKNLPASTVSPQVEEPVLIIDPGHGGEDGGAVSPDGLVESGVNLDISLRLNDLCGFFGVKSIMTREGESLEYPPDLQRTAERKRWDTRRRTALINSVDNAVLLSIHQNNYPDGGPRGPQAFYGKLPRSRELAEQMHENLIAFLYPESRRVAAPVPKEVYIMSNALCPAVLVECAFLSNGEDCTLLRTEEHRRKIGAILMASYLQYTEAGYES